MMIIRRRVTIATISPLLSLVRGCWSGLHLFLPPSVFRSAFRPWFPLGLLHLQLFAPRDEGGCGSISYGYMCCCVALCLFCTVIIQVPGFLLRIVSGNRV